MKKILKKLVVRKSYLVGLLVIVSLLLASLPVTVGASDGLVSHWPAEGNADDVVDGNHGTLKNGATFAPGKVGQAFSLDGYNQFILVPHNANLNLGEGQDFTIAARVNLQNPTSGSDDVIVMKGDIQLGRESASYSMFNFWIQRDTNPEDSRKLLLQLRESRGDLNFIELSNSSIMLNTWTHVAVVREGAEARFYIDGALDRAVTMTDGDVSNSEPLAIGGIYDTHSQYGGDGTQHYHAFGGLLDEVKIYNRVLTDEEIAEHAGGPSISDLDADPDTFNSDTGSTTVNYILNDVTDAPVVLEIYTSDNNLVRSIDAGLQSSGAHSIDWDGNDQSGTPVAEGLYTARLNVTMGDGDGYTFVLKWGSPGDDPGEFNNPRHVDIGPNGDVYVVDQSNDRVQKFSADGTFITEWEGYGSGDDQFTYPTGISVDSDGFVYVSFKEFRRLQKFNADGDFVSSFPTPWGTLGNQVDSSGNIYVAAHFPPTRVLKYNPYGTLDTWWGCSGNPWDVALDSEGNVYVTNSWGKTVSKFTSSGDLLKSWWVGVLTYDIAIDSNDNVLVSAANNDRVYKFTSDGTLIMTLGTSGTGDGQFNSPVGLAFDQAGNLYVGDAGNNRVQKFAPATTGITAETDILVDNSDDEPNIAIIDTKKAKVRWHHSDLHIDGKLYLPEGVGMNDLASAGNAVITLADVDVTDQDVEFVTKGKNDEKWEYKDKKNDYGNIKEFKIDWKEAKFDYKGDSKFHIHTHGIGASETILCLHTGDVSGAFTVNIDGTTIAYDENGNVITDIEYEPQKEDNSHVHFSLPFQLTPDMTIEVTGAVEELSLNVADYFDEAYAKFKLVSAFEAGSFPDGTDTLPDTLEFNITLGDDPDIISGSDLIGVEKAWTKKDDKHWEYKKIK